MMSGKKAVFLLACFEKHKFIQECTQFMEAVEVEQRVCGRK